MQASAVPQAHIVPDTASAPLIVQTRGNLNIAPNLLHSMSLKAGVPLQLTRKIGSGTYLMRPAKRVTSQGLRTIASRLSAHPSVLGAHIYQQAAPAYILAPAGHQLALNGSRLSGSKSPLVNYRWQQIAGPRTALSGTSKPVMTFLARQATSATPSVSDPTAVSPGDLSAPPQQFQCAISAASTRNGNMPQFTTRQSFMCNPGAGGATPPGSSSSPGGGTPTDNSGSPVTSTPTDNSGSPVTSTPTDNSGSPVTSTPTGNSGNPVSSTPPDNSSYPGTGTPGNNYGQPSAYPSGGGTPGGGSGCNPVANAVGIGVSNAVANGGGTANSVGLGVGNAQATCNGQGNGNAIANSIGIGLSHALAGMSAHRPAVQRRAVPGSSVLGFRLIATDRTGVAHVRNIYVRVYRPAATSVKRQTASPGRHINPLKR